LCGGGAGDAVALDAVLLDAVALDAVLLDAVALVLLDAVYPGPVPTGRAK
jgi:hypothetical protein